jgi:predicted PurR-regulated permease PerM
MATKPLQKHRALTIAVSIAVLFGAYFLRHFFSAIAFAAISAYLFSPVHNWFTKKTKRTSSAASLTLLTTGLTILLPAVLIIVFMTFQINHLLSDITTKQVNLGKAGQDVFNWVNDILSRIPGAHNITTAQLTQAAEKAVTSLLKLVLDIILSSVGSISSFITSFIIYIYVFLSLLVNKDKIIDTIRRLNPLGPEMTDQYLEKAGAMTSGMTRGQFVIAICQGFAEAVILQTAGIHGLFFFLFVLLTVISLIPLGAGIVAVPIGIIMLLLGDIWQGAVVLLGHILIVTNIDNVLRPRLVPKNVRLNSALIMLSVFSGIAMFGFLGIIIGPIIMIMIKLTIDAYLQVTAPRKKSSAARGSVHHQ